MAADDDFLDNWTLLENTTYTADQTKQIGDVVYRVIGFQVKKYVFVENHPDRGYYEYFFVPGKVLRARDLDMPAPARPREIRRNRRAAAGKGPQRKEIHGWNDGSPFGRY